ncbi:MAG: hypothetical protein K9G44_10900 [Melioribacteraceae bacterium]|nr:hypothetical protein [Melioribacteraceae bacterium]
MKMIEIWIRKLLLNSFLFFRSNSKNKNAGAKIPVYGNVLVIRLNRIGDALVTTPLIRLLKNVNEYKVFVLADRKNSFIFNGNKDISKVIVFEKGIGGFKQINRIIRENNIKIVVDSHDDVSTTVSFLVALAKVSVKVGFAKGNDKIYTHLVEKPDPKNVHVIERVASLISPFDKNKPQNLKVIYNLTENSDNIAEKFLREHNLKSSFLIGINISAGSDARFWGVSNYQRIIMDMEHSGANVFLLAHEKDREKAENISGGKLQIFCHPDLNVFAAIVSKLDLLFSPDTSIVHIAAAYRIPVFGLYVQFNTDNLPWFPYNSLHEYVLTKEPTLENVGYEIVAQKFFEFMGKI